MYTEDMKIGFRERLRVFLIHKTLNKKLCPPFRLFTQDLLRAAIQKLYATIIVGTSPCHAFTKAEGRTGGFYHVVCRHGVCVFNRQI